MSIERFELEVLADMTVRLTKLRQDHCNHLCVENVAPEIFHNLLMAYSNSKPNISGVGAMVCDVDAVVVRA